MMSRDVAIVAYGQIPSVRWQESFEEPEMVNVVTQEALGHVGLGVTDMDFICSGSCDYIGGIPFAFVSALDGIGCSDPMNESHVEMDGAFALYEAWVHLLMGDAETALIYAFGKSSAGNLRTILTHQLDPYVLAPLGVDTISMAALQARLLLESGRYEERDFLSVVARSQRDALKNPFAQLCGEQDVEKLLEEDYIVSPLRRPDCAPISDGAAAVILAKGDRARELTKTPVWIRGMDHRIEPHLPGMRDLTQSVSTQQAAQKIALSPDTLDIAELHAPFSPQELILCDALKLPKTVRINPSGGALVANPFIVTGLIRFIEAARRLTTGEGKRAVVHATNGQCLQHNLLALLEVQDA